MAVNLSPPQGLLPVRGVRLGIVEAGVSRRSRPDLALIACDEGTAAAGLFTTNAFCAAPVRLCRKILRSRAPVRGLLINAGNANAGTGERGMEDALRCTRAAEVHLGGAVLPFSTGVIGVPLPVGRIESAIPRAVADLREDGWLDAARAIMTTDTVPKGASRQCQIGGRAITMTGIAKGAGMICPDMATMLAFVATDAKLSRTTLARALELAAADSFNAITVDGDMSTNDSLMLLATGGAGGRALAAESEEFGAFVEALSSLCAELAQAVVRDGEGATRFITIRVRQADSREQARAVAYTLAHSPLFKTAAFAGDANWGRILAAVGRSPVPDMDMSQVDIAIDEVSLIRGGEPDPDYSEDAGSRVFGRAEFTVDVVLGRGRVDAQVYTCDLSHDYVRINAEYRT